MPDQLISGLDLGQRADFSVLASVRRTPLEKPVARRRYHYALVHLQTWELGTDYWHPEKPSIIGGVKETFSQIITKTGKAPLAWTPLAVDATGVGAAVVEQIRSAKVPALLHPVWITSGHAVKSRYENDDGFWHVPKVELVGTLISLLDAKLLSWKSPGTPGALKLAARFEKELLAFREFVTAKKNRTFEAESSQHDDMVLAVSLACFLGERSGGDVSGISVPEGADASVTASAPEGVYQNHKGE